MAHSDPLPANVLDNISRQLGRNLATLSVGPPGAAGVPDELAESYAVWTVDEKSVTKFDSRMSTLARNTGNWHHQVRRVTAAPGGATSDKVIAYARSEPRGPEPGDWAVVATTEVTPQFDLGTEIRNAAAWIDESIPGDPLVRMLIMPSRYLHAFWLVYPNRDDIVVIDMPKSFTHLKYQKVYNAHDFLENLSLEPVVRGVGK
jgi:hypothetical protein